MRRLNIIAVLMVSLFVSSCGGNSNNNNAGVFGNILSNPDVVNGIVSGKSATEIATSALLNNIGIGNITGGASGGAGGMLSSLIGGGKSSGSSLASSALSNGLVKNVLSQTLNSSGFLNKSNPKYLLNADISDITKAVSGNGGSGSVLYNLVGAATGDSVLSKSVTSPTSSNPTSTIINNATQLMGLLKAFK